MHYKYACLECGADTFDRGYDVKGGTLCIQCAFTLKQAKARAAGMAAATRGRKTHFKDRKKDASRKACRKDRYEKEA